MRNYQSVLILKPDLDEAQVDQAVDQITAMIQKFGGSVLKLDKWGKKRLAYRVKKNKFGYYLNIYHTCDQAGIAGLEKEYQLHELIIKYLVIRLAKEDIERVMSQKTEEESAKEQSAGTEKAAAGEQTEEEQ